MTTANYLEMLRLAAPEAILVGTVLVVLGADVLGLRASSITARRLGAGLIAIAGCILSGAWMLGFTPQGTVAGGVFVVTSLNTLLKLAILVMTLATIILSLEWTGTEPPSTAEQESFFTAHPAEYVALILLGAMGMMFLMSSDNLLMIFISLELTSVPLYILAGFNKRDLTSAEAALKYFLFGGMSAAFTLYGISLLYGISGSIHLGEISKAIHQPSLDPLLILALVMTAAGFVFKIAAAPFHMWAPDVYQAAPTPSAAFIASGSKVAGFFILARMMIVGFGGAEGAAVLTNAKSGWVPLLAIIAGVSMVLGNLAAIVQSDVRRLLAYSAVAHAGYTLVGIISGSAGLAYTLYYAITYAITAIGAFGVISIVEEQSGGHQLKDFAGLNRRDPLVAFCLLVFLLSLAGIPPLAGFFGKFSVFASALRVGLGLGLLWLVVLAIGVSAVSLYYYLQVAKQAYVAETPLSSRRTGGALLTKLAVAGLAAAVILLGCFPDWLVAKLEIAILGSGF